MWGDFGGLGVVLDKHGGGCPWLGGRDGLFVVGWVVVISYVAMFPRLAPCNFFIVGFFIVTSKTQSFDVHQNPILFNSIAEKLRF